MCERGGERESVRADGARAIQGDGMNVSTEVSPNEVGILPVWCRVVRNSEKLSNPRYLTAAVQI